MEKELSIIDGILMNLAGVLRFYEFEHIQYTNLLHTLKNFQNETLSEPELKSSDKIFKDESNNEINNIEKKVKDLEQKIKEIRADISSRNQSKEKLISLFNALKSVDSIKSLSTSAAQNDDAVKTKEFDGVELPIMEIREELDDDDNIISTDIKPYQSSETQLKALFQNTEHLNTENQKTSVEKPKTPIAVEARLEKEEKQTGINKKQLESNNTVLEDSDNPNSANFLPFVIREEIDEDGNIIKSSMSRIPQMKPTDENDENDISNDLVIREPENEKDQIDEDQLTELFEDMGFTLPKVTDVTGDDNVKEDVEKLAESNISEDISKIPLKGDSDLASSTSNNLPTAHNVDPNDIYTLELIADELNQQECDEEREVNVEIDDDFEWPEIDDHDNDEEEEEDNDDDYDIQKRVFTNMFGGKVQNRFAQEIMNLRKHKSTSNETNEVVVHEVDNVIVEPEVAEIVEEITPVETLPKIENKAKKLKKSVSFNSTVDIKKVDDIWDDLRASNAENEINDLQNKSKKSSSSIFKRTRETVSSNSPVGRKEDLKEEEKKDVVISDVMERQIVESDPEPQPLPHHDVFKKFDSISLRKQLDDTMSQLEQKTNLTKISGKKGPSKFKLARAAEIGKKFQETHIPSEVREQLQTMADLIDKKENIQESNSQLTPVLKKNLNSLKPNKGKSTSQKSHKIETPVDINPLPVNPQSLADEDYEIVRNEASDGLFDDDDDIPEAEFVASEIKENEEIISDEYKEPSTKSKDDDVNEYFPVYTKKGETNKETEVVGTTLDYKMISDDLDTMAKAYVLGLYDDDIHTTGDVIEELDDFEKHNKVVEDIENSQLHERVTEINKKLEGEDGKIEEILEDDNPMVVSDIVENDMNDILEANDIPDDQLDIELNDENLATQVALDYTKMRSNMIHKYKGGFKETDKEKEFVRPEGSERVSRFKMARLGM